MDWLRAGSQAAQDLCCSGVVEPMEKGDASTILSGESVVLPRMLGFTVFLVGMATCGFMFVEGAFSITSRMMTPKTEAS